ncbi:MAG: SUMF1/EgtB/PvdO family nonheme iron enzyme [Bacteroidales bacterium]|jgi:formylglycine-generating enzyme|nr:SUMF1/EgtB/PvdO family nonheme iron enzyme [Bacteroidales bacterium]MDD3161864.1 SUMF1/EgtB/PvdO family nonheme iron enzyme [Bacteroidales bacterium]
MLILSSCMGTGSSSGELVGVGGTAWSEPAPYGMVQIKSGSIQIGPNEKDSLWGITAPTKEVSVDAFWMDETEITNSKYKQFVFWVRDSIIRERLFDPNFGGDESYKIEEDKNGDPIKPRLNWKKPLPTPRRATEDELRALGSVYYMNPIDGVKTLDAAQMNYHYEWFDHTNAALRSNRINPLERERNTDITIDPNQQVMISKDTAFFDDEGRIVNQTVTRPLQSLFDFLHTRIVNIYPDTTCWVNDFSNSYNEPYMKLYFSHPGYNNYPVVGVSWEQATAFCVWRTNLLRASTFNMSGRQIMEYRLPTEAEWEYAARAGNTDQLYPWATNGTQSQKGCFYANFKPERGNYPKDGNLIPASVAAYAPNEFGLYDMAGNVAEWTSTAYTESGVLSQNDMNPDFRYDAAKEDPYNLKRKVVRGGSWKDVAEFVRSDSRTFEYQNESRSYIGFRCVRSLISNGKRK